MILRCNTVICNTSLFRSLEHYFTYNLFLTRLVLPLSNVSAIKHVWLQFQFAFGLHDFFQDGFGPRLFPREGINATNHLVVGFPLVLEIASARIINVALLGNAVQPVDPRIPALQAFLQMRAGPHVLVLRAMKFNARFPQPFLHVQSTTDHTTGAAASSSPYHRVCVAPSHPTRSNWVDVST